jgi:endonuclease G
MSKIDRYLLQSLRADEGEPAMPTAAMFPTATAVEISVAMPEMEIEAADVEAGVEPVEHAEAVIPLLLRVESPSWDGSAIPGLRIHSRLGPVVSAHGSLESLAALERDAAVQSVEASRPLENPGELATSVPLVHGDDVHTVHGEEGDLALVGIVDAGIDVLHEAFRDGSGRTRIVALWDQQDGSGVPARHPFGYGTLHLDADIDGYIATGVVPAGLGRDPDGHGTHVASIAAGRAAGSFAGGLAPAASLVVVRSQQRRFEGGQVASLGYSHNHVDALAWIRQVAEAEDLPVAVNMSLGMNAGAHDGSSLLEIAFDEFSSGGRASGRVIVKSAGNEGGRRGHAQLVMRTGDAETIRWQTRNVSRDQDLIEIWYRSGHDLEFELEDPSGDRTGTVSLAAPTDAGIFPSGDRWDLDLERLHSDNGDSRLLVRIHRGGLPATFATGTWRLHVRAVAAFGDCRIDAWIERRNARALSFQDHLIDEYSLSIPGTARTVIAVGSVSPSAPFGVATSSSRGPTRDERTKPDVTAPGDGIRAARGGTATGTLNMPGTSMAAPHVTGALALLMSHWRKREAQVPGWRQLNAMQMRAALVQTADGFSGAHDPARGFGRLDVRALIDSFS